MTNINAKSLLGVIALFIAQGSYGGAPASQKPFPYIKEGDDKALFAVCGHDEGTCDTAEHVALDNYQLSYTSQYDGTVATFIRLSLSREGKKKFIALTKIAAKEDKLVSLLSCDHHELVSWHIMDRISNLETLDVQLESALEDVVGPAGIINCGTK